MDRLNFDEVGKPAKRIVYCDHCGDFADRDCPVPLCPRCYELHLQELYGTRLIKPDAVDLFILSGACFVFVIAVCLIKAALTL